MDEVVATAQRDTLDIAAEIEQDNIDNANDDIKDNVRESALAASLTGYRNSTKVIGIWLKKEEDPCTVPLAPNGDGMNVK